jgi:4-deoxy-L-threo-5-hexosulose-uronate ketol-isomerase
MDLIRTHHPDSFRQLDTAALRRDFLVSGLFAPGRLEMRYWEVDRTILGGVVPLDEPVELTATRALLGADSFCDRREIGIVNLGGPGAVETFEDRYNLERLDALYLGRGTRAVQFHSVHPSRPAQFYLVSYPAHASYPCKLVPFAQAQSTLLGAPETANRRRLCKLLVPGMVETCQLVLGVTLLESGSIWNTMPCHTHERRSEVYLYFDIPPTAAVFHYLGRPQETRHLVVRDREAALSPSWSIHSGAGTAAYGFVWAMGGENQEFSDMDGLKIEDLR